MPSNRTRRQLMYGSTAILTALAGCANSEDSQTTPANTTEQADTNTDTQTTPANTTEQADTNTDTQTTTSSSVESLEIGEEFTQQFTSGEYSEAVEQFAPYFKTGFKSSAITILSGLDTAERALERHWTALTSEHGELQEITDISPTESGVEIAIDFEDTTQNLLLGISDGEITDITLSAEQFTPEYVDEAVVTEEEHSVQADGPELRGRLTLPENTDSQTPAVVLVQGVGGLDFDYTHGPNRFFRDLAHGLATQGIASYRYEKRTHVSPNIPPENQSIDTITVNDAVAAVGQIASHDRIDSEQVSVAGHSRGGRLAPRIAKQASEDLAGVVILDGYSLPLAVNFEKSLQNIRNADYLTEQEKSYRRQYAETFQNLSEDGLSDEETVAGWSGAYWQSYFDYTPTDTLNELTADVFIAQNERNIAPAEASLNHWLENTDKTITSTLYPEQNHSFQRGHGDIYIPYATVRLPGAFSEQTVNDLSDWILEN